LEFNLIGYSAVYTSILTGTGDMFTISLQAIMFLVSHACSSQVALLDLTLELQECLLIMSGNNSSSCSSLDALQSLGAAEPSWVVTGQPALWDTITPL
jgi:hypothetical protein